jgi:lipopolysaccharide assembly protein A
VPSASKRDNIKNAISLTLRKETVMRWVYLAIIVLLVVVTLVFALQNLEMITVSFLGFGIRAPLAILVTVVYLLGAVTGGSLLALLRRLVEGSRRHLSAPT